MAARTDKARSDLDLALEEHLKKFPDSPIGAVIASPDIESRLVRFREADATALKRQKSHLGIGRAALWTTMLGTVVGAVALLPIDDAIEGGSRSAIEGFQALALFVGFLASSLCPSSHKWMVARATAEAARADVFRSIMRAGAGAKDLLGPALACFRDAHLDWQLGFFHKRGRELHRSLGTLALYRMAAYVLRVIVGLFAVLILVKLAAWLGQYWPLIQNLADWLQTLLRELQIDRPERWQLGFGVMATGILAFTTARDLMDRSGENVERYRRVAIEVEGLRRDDLPTAEAAAQSGNAAEVLDFCERVQSVLSAEHLAWLYGGGTDGTASMT